MTEEQYIADVSAWMGGVSAVLGNLNWGGWLNGAISVIEDCLRILSTVVPGSGPLFAKVEPLIDRVIEVLDAIF